MGSRIKQQYCWIIVLIVSLEMAVFGGLLNSINVFIIPICEDLGVSRGSYAATEIPYRVCGALSTLISVVLFQKYGYKKTTVFSLSVVIGALVLCSVSKSLMLLGICRAMLGFGYGTALTTSAVWIVKFWFARHQGTIIGLVSMFTGLGGSAMTMVLTAWIEDYGWRMTNLICAGMIGAVVVCYLLLVVDRPEKLGVRPFGYGDFRMGRKKLNPDTAWAGRTVQQWAKRPLLYWMIGFTVVSTVVCYMAYSVLVPHFQDRGFLPQQAALYQSVCMLVLAASKLLCGTTSDKVGAKAVGACCILCCGVGHGILSCTDDAVLCYLGVSLIAVGLCLTAVLPPLLVPAMFGYYSADSITSILLAVISISCIFSNLIANTGFDMFTSYCPTFLGAAVVSAVLLGVYGYMMVLARRERRAFENESKEESYVLRH